MTAEALALIASYFLCSEAAETQVLDRAQLDACIVTYTEVKLSFLPDLDIDDYQQMSAPERAEANQQGYAAYVRWRAVNGALVAQMEAEARRRLAGSGS